MSTKGSGIGRAIAFACAATLSFVIPASALAHHNGSAGHLPPVEQNMELVGELELTGEFGDVVPGQIADLAVHDGYAYLNSWDEPSCTRGGTYIADISDPANPQEIGFIPVSEDGFYHGEGAHVVSIDTPEFTGDVLAVNNEACSNATNRPAHIPQTAGGFDLYDVTDPANPVTLVQDAGDRSPESSVIQNPAEPFANSYHSVFVWQEGPRAFLVGVDNTELSDVDIYDISDPANPEFINDLDLAAAFPSILDGEEANGENVFLHDMVVKPIGGRQVMLANYWDAGYVQLDVTDPQSPTLINDTTFAGEDPLLPGTGLFREGNAHQGEYSFDNQFFLAADEDFGPRPTLARILDAPFANDQFGGVLADAEPYPPDTTVESDTQMVGFACDPLPAPPAGVTVALAERGGPAGGCSFQVKVDNIQAAGYDLALIFNNDQPAPNRCDTLINMLLDPATTNIPSIFISRTNAFKIMGVYDPATYVCDEVNPGSNTPTPAAPHNGLTVRFTSLFDGWGYAHLFDAQTGDELDTFAIPEAIDDRFETGFGDLSIHEFATDPETNLAYSSYYAGGVRVFEFSRAGGLRQRGAYIDPEGSNFWGIEQYTPPGGGRLIAGSDRDFGLQIFRYTGPGAVQPPVGGGPPPAGEPPPGDYGETKAPKTKITDKPDKKTTKRKAKFKFTSNEPNSTFECKLDKKDFKSCDSPFKKKVDVGKHKFKVRAIDAAGNVDPSPATYSWKVVQEEKK